MKILIAGAGEDEGRYVAFESYATNLSPQDNNSGRDVYLWDGTTGSVSVGCNE